jgi:protein tyrosine phosphatase
LPGGVNGFSHQFKKLDQIPSNKDQIRAANHALNMRKNRLLTILPYDYNRVVLPGKMGVEQSDYVNASYIDGYSKQREFIATQAPLSDTTEDFWRMVAKEKSSIIVMLTELVSNNEEKCAQYWPVVKDQWVAYDSVQVHMTEENQQWNGLNLTHRKFYVLRDGSEDPFETDHYQLHGWSSDGCPDETTSTIEFIKYIQALGAHDDIGSTIVHCCSGAGPTGCFIGLYISIQRLLVENIIDIFQTVKTLRTQRQHLVKSNDQYTFIFRGIREYLTSRSKAESYSESYNGYQYG